MNTRRLTLNYETLTDVFNTEDNPLFVVGHTKDLKGRYRAMYQLRPRENYLVCECFKPFRTQAEIKKEYPSVKTRVYADTHTLWVRTR